MRTIAEAKAAQQQAYLRYKVRHPDRVKAATKAWRIRNSERWKAYQKAYKERRKSLRRLNPQKEIDAYYLRVRGLTPEQVLELKKNGCMICGSKTRKLVIDHSHESGEVRGCLCSDCNALIGKLGDGLNVDKLRKIVVYLGLTQRLIEGETIVKEGKRG